MGYTNYITTEREFTDEEWNAITTDFKKIIDACDVKIVGGCGSENTVPTIDDNCIAFNGIEDESYETAYLSKTMVAFEFCKTNRKPYDILVKSLFFLAKREQQELKFGFDGDVDDDEYVDMLEILTRCEIKLFK